MCRVMEHNHLFPETELLTTQNGDRTRPIDFLPGHQLANHQAHVNVPPHPGWRRLLPGLEYPGSLLFSTIDVHMRFERHGRVDVF